MSMSSSVIGIKPPDEKWRQMKAIYDACIAAKVEVPAEVWSYFNGYDPDDSGVVLDRDKLNGAVSEYRAEMQEGFEVNLAVLPKDVKVIRFFNSY